VDEADGATVKSADRKSETPRNGGKPKKGVRRRRTLTEYEEKKGWEGRGRWCSCLSSVRRGRDGAACQNRLREERKWGVEAKRLKA